MVNNKMNFHELGIAGFTINSLLAVIVLWRWLIYCLDVHQESVRNSRKKHAAFLLLLIANICDLPMYASFFIDGDYVLETYSYHKFEGAAVFGAFSLVISDWSAVLFEIREDSYIPFLFRSISLVAINILLWTICLINFIYCYSIDSLTSYAESEVYIAGLFIQIIAPFVLTCLMLHAGIKLYLRIHGASRRINDSPDQSFKSKEFKSALFHLIVLMSSLAVAIFIQVILNSLNYALGYHNSPNETVGPSLAYFTFTEFLPLSVLTLALLFLSRSNPNRNNHHANHNQHMDPTAESDSSLKKAQKSLSRQYFGKDSNHSQEDEGLVSASHSDEITSPFLCDPEGDPAASSFASSNQYTGNFRTNTYEYCIGTGDESGTYRASDSSRAPARYHGAMGNFLGQSNVDGPISTANSENSTRQDDILAAYDPFAGLRPSIIRPQTMT